MPLVLDVLSLTNIWMANGFEWMLRRSIRVRDQAPWCALGIRFSIREAERYLGTSLMVDDKFDPFHTDANSSYVCDELVRSYAEELKDFGSHEMVMAARFVSAVFVLRSIADNPTRWISRRARDSIPSNWNLRASCSSTTRCRQALGRLREPTSQ
jgi:hypothetical protein